MNLGQAHRLNIGDIVKVLPNMVEIMLYKYDDYTRSMDRFIGEELPIKYIDSYRGTHLKFTLSLNGNEYYFTEECIESMSIPDATLMYAPRKKVIDEKIIIKFNDFC